jgi:hypothetical protein
MKSEWLLALMLFGIWLILLVIAERLELILEAVT